MTTTALIPAVDPVLDTDDWWWQPLAVVGLKVLVIFVVGLVGTMFMAPGAPPVKSEATASIRPIIASVISAEEIVPAWRSWESSVADLKMGESLDIRKLPYSSITLGTTT